MASVRCFYWIILHHSFSIRPLMPEFFSFSTHSTMVFFSSMQFMHRILNALDTCECAFFFLVYNWTGVCAHTAKQHVILDAVYTNRCCFFLLSTTLWNASDFRSGWSYKFRNQRSNWVWMCSIKFDIMHRCKNGFQLCFAGVLTQSRQSNRKSFARNQYFSRIDTVWKTKERTKKSICCIWSIDKGCVLGYAHRWIFLRQHPTIIATTF